MMKTPKPQRVWTVAEAKAKLSEVLRLAEEEGPQRIGTRKPFIVMPEHTWRTRARRGKTLGQWLVENMPRGVEIEIPERKEPGRTIPFSDERAE